MKWIAVAWVAQSVACFGGEGSQEHPGAPTDRTPLDSRELLMRRAIILQGGAQAPHVPTPAAPGLLPPLTPLGEAPPPRGPSYPRHTPTLPQGMTITIDKIFSDKPFSDGIDDHPPQASRPIVLPRQAAQRLAACWAPPVPQRGDTVEVTLRFAFDRGGSVLWPPRITYLKPGQGASAEEVRDSILAAFKACTPLHFSASMAASMPGYPLSVRFIGRRGE